MTVVDNDRPAAPPQAAWRQRVESLLPPTPAERHKLGYLIAFLAAVGFLLLTPAGQSHLTHLWAEDGALFLRESLTESFGTNLVTPYGGYLHVVPRLIAELMSVLPLTWAPIVAAVAVSVIRAGIAVLVFAASGGYLRWLPVRLTLAALVIILPAGNSETLDNLANLHWFLLYGAFWALLWRPKSHGLNLLAAAVIFLAATSSPLVFLLAPLALLRLTLPAWRDRLSTIAFGAGSIPQTLAVLFATRTPYSTQSVDPVQLVLASLLRVPVVTFTGSEQVARIYPKFGNWPILAALLLAAVPIIAALIRGQTTHRFLALLGVFYSILIITVVLTTNWSPALQVQQPLSVMAAQRYSAAPCLFLLTAIAAGLDLLPQIHWQRTLILSTRALIPAILLASITLHLRANAGKLDGPPWQTTVTQAHQTCATGTPEATLPHQPTGWFFVLPCPQLPG